MGLDDLRSPANECGTIHLSPPCGGHTMQRECATGKVQEESPVTIERKRTVRSVACWKRGVDLVEPEAFEGPGDLDVNAGPRLIGTPSGPRAARGGQCTDAPIEAAKARCMAGSDEIGRAHV